MTEINQVVVEAVLEKSRSSRRQLVRGVYEQPACGCATGMYAPAAHRGFGAWANGMADALQVSFKFAQGVENGFEGWPVDHAQYLTEDDVAEYDRGRATGAEIWRRRAEGADQSGSPVVAALPRKDK